MRGRHACRPVPPSRDATLSLSLSLALSTISRAPFIHVCRKRDSINVCHYDRRVTDSLPLRCSACVKVTVSSDATHDFKIVWHHVAKVRGRHLTERSLARVLALVTQVRSLCCRRRRCIVLPSNGERAEDDEEENYAFVAVYVVDLHLLYTLTVLSLSLTHSLSLSPS